MRYGLIFVLAVGFCHAGSLRAQEPPANKPAASDGAGPTPSTPSTPTDAPAANASPAAASKSAENCPPYHGWVRAEYLFWWMKNAPLPVPIVTTGNPAVGFDPNNVNTVNTAGAIGQPGTRVLVGGHGVPFGPLSGLRLGVGVWADDDETFGLDASGFALERQSNDISLKSDNPVTYRFISRFSVGLRARNGPFPFPIRSAALAAMSASIRPSDFGGRKATVW